MEWPSPIGVARDVSPEPMPCSSRNASSGSSTSSGGTAVSLRRPLVVSHDVVGCDRRCSRPQRYKDRNLLCAEVSLATMPKLRTLLLTLLACRPCWAASRPPDRRSPRTAKLTYFEGSSAAARTRARARTRSHRCSTSACARCASSSPGRDVAPGPDKRRRARPSTRPTPPATPGGSYDALHRRSPGLHWYGAADGHRARRRGGRRPTTKRRTSRGPTTRTSSEFMTAVGASLRLRGLVCSRSGTSPTTRPSCCRSGTPTARPPRRASTAVSTRPATTVCRPAGIAHPRVLFGETAPTGYDNVNVRREGSRALLHDVAPLAFLRGALCLNATLPASPARAARCR